MAKICTAVEINFVHSVPIDAPQCKLIWTAVEILAVFRHETFAFAWRYFPKLSATPGRHTQQSCHVAFQETIKMFQNSVKHFSFRKKHLG
jgi:hypothetical protein